MKVVFKGNGKKEVLEVPFPGSRTVYFKVNEPVELSADEFKRIEKNIPEVFLVVPEKVEEVKEEKEPVVPEKVEDNPEPVKTPKRKYKRKKGGNK